MQEGPTRNSPSTSTSDPTTTNTNNNHNNTTITTNEITKKTKRKLTDFYPHLGMIFPIAYSATSNKQADGYVRIAHSSTSRIPPSPSCLHFLPLSLPPFPSLPLPCFRPPLSPSLPPSLPLVYDYNIYSPLTNPSPSILPPTYRFTARALIESLQFQAKLYQEWMEVMGEK